MFKCVQCNRMFSSKDNLVRHNKIHKNVQFTCEICFKTFARKDNLAKHTKNMHGMYFQLNKYDYNNYFIFFFKNILIKYLKSLLHLIFIR
jgi:uncharacterized Zn-finger protein